MRVQKVNVGGSFLKVLFGTATVADLADLHSTLGSMRDKQGEVIHSVNSQLTYIKQMDATVKTVHEAIGNWSYVLKDIALKSQEKFQKTVTRLEWAVKLQEGTTAATHLEFTLTQLQFQIGTVLEAFHTLVTGRLPPGLIAPSNLHDILTNVSLSLHEGYDLLLGTQYNNLPGY
jgi:hypothetical protein